MKEGGGEENSNYMNHMSTNKDIEDCKYIIPQMEILPF